MHNEVSLVGRLTKQPELSKTQAGKSAVYFTLAVKQNKDITYWIDCHCFANTAEFLNTYFRKGDLIALSGSLNTYSKNNSTIMYVNVRDVMLLNRPGSTQDSQSNLQPGLDMQSPVNITSDDLPF